MRFPPVILLSLAVAVAISGTESTDPGDPCYVKDCNSNNSYGPANDHSAIVADILNIFGEENCAQGLDNAGIVTSLECEHRVGQGMFPLFRGYILYEANYCASASNDPPQHVPYEIQASYSTSVGSSWEEFDFRDSCYSDSSIIRSIRSSWIDDEDDAPTPSGAPIISEYPVYSEYPVSEYPVNSDYPNSFSPLSSSPDGTENPRCEEDSHESVMGRLDRAFGEGNCGTTTDSDDLLPMWDCGCTEYTPAGQYACFMEVPGYFEAAAEYSWLDLGALQPFELTVRTTYTHENGSSLMSMKYFVDDCLDGCLDDGEANAQLSNVRYQRLNPQPPPSESPSTTEDPACADDRSVFEYKNNKTTSCRKLSKTLPYKKLTKFCDKFPVAADRCPGVCGNRDGDCPCTDNAHEFPGFKKKKGGKLFSCDKLSNMRPQRKTKLCRKDKYISLCPGVCDEQCT